MHFISVNVFHIPVGKNLSMAHILLAPPPSEICDTQFVPAPAGVLVDVPGSADGGESAANHVGKYVAKPCE